MSVPNSSEPLLKTILDSQQLCTVHTYIIDNTEKAGNNRDVISFDRLADALPIIVNPFN